VAAYAAGAVIGGAAVIRYRPQPMLLGAMLCLSAWSLLLFALAVPLSVAADAAAALLAGLGVEISVVLWITTRQQEIPAAMPSRISSYDIFGRSALAPLGALVSGPLASVYGREQSSPPEASSSRPSPAATIFLPEVRHMRRRVPSAAG
jgi:hypothetical protein